MRMQRLKMQRAAQLQLEVAALARMGSARMGLGGFPSLAGGSLAGGAPLSRGGSFGPARREPDQGRGARGSSSSKPYDRPAPHHYAASRTNSTVSCMSPRPSSEGEDFTLDESISPLSSPYLAASVSLLSTPELFGIVDGKRCLSPLALDGAPEAAKHPSPSMGERSETTGSLGSCVSPSPGNGQVVGRAGRASPTPERKPVHDFHATATCGGLLDGSPAKKGSADGPLPLTCLDLLSDP